jgi:hypothetical protein
MIEKPYVKQKKKGGKILFQENCLGLSRLGINLSELLKNPFEEAYLALNSHEISFFTCPFQYPKKKKTPPA